jgi:chaperone required for assembly of F1-ATPase
MDGPKRFYRAACVVRGEQGFGIALDGKTVHTPGRRSLVVPREALAAAIAAEWNAQGERLVVRTMPLLHLAYRAIDIVGPERSGTVATIAGFARTDLLCYRAEAPADLVARQHGSWQPLLDWAAERFGVALASTKGVVFIEQAPSALAAYRSAVDRYDDMMLTGIAQATETLGSLVLGLALSEGRIDAGEAIALAELDEIHQMERWGEDADALHRRKEMGHDVLSAARFMALARA